MKCNRLIITGTCAFGGTLRIAKPIYGQWNQANTLYLHFNEFAFATPFPSLALYFFFPRYLFLSSHSLLYCIFTRRKKKHYNHSQCWMLQYEQMLFCPFFLTRLLMHFFYILTPEWYMSFVPFVIWFLVLFFLCYSSRISCLVFCAHS